jgi:hypothetical protein
MKYLILLLTLMGCTQSQPNYLIPQELEILECEYVQIDTVYQEVKVPVYIIREKDLNEISFLITDWVLLLDMESKDTIGGSLPLADIYARQFTITYLEELQNKINQQ